MRNRKFKPNLCTIHLVMRGSDGRCPKCRKAGITEPMTESEKLARIHDAAPELFQSLRDLTEFCTSGRRYKTQNPYTIPEIKAALKAIGQAKGLSITGDAWMDANKDREREGGLLEP